MSCIHVCGRGMRDWVHAAIRAVRGHVQNSRSGRPGATFQYALPAKLLARQRGVSVRHGENRRLTTTCCDGLTWVSQRVPGQGELSLLGCALTLRRA